MSAEERIANSAWRRRFGLRLVLDFLVCALVPMLIFSGLTYYSTRAQLLDDASGTLTRDVKSASMAIVERIDIGEAQLRNRLAEGSVESSAGSSAFSAIEYLAPEDASIGADARDHLATGRAYLQLALAGDADQAALFVASESRIVRGRFDLSYLFGPDRVGEGEAYWAMLQGGEFIFGVSLGPDGEIKALSSAPQAPVAARTEFDLTVNGRESSGVVWPLFLRNPYGSDALHIGLAKSRSSILRPLDHFEFLFLAVLALSLLTSTVIALHRIRVRVGPLETLTKTAMKSNWGTWTRVRASPRVTSSNCLGRRSIRWRSS